MYNIIIDSKCMIRTSAISAVGCRMGSCSVGGNREPVPTQNRFQQFHRNRTPPTLSILLNDSAPRFPVYAKNLATTLRAPTTFKQQGSIVESRKRSQVWLHFTKRNENSAVCNQCNAIISCKGANTSNMLKHLSTKHGIKSQECHVFKSLHTSQTSATVSSVDNDCVTLGPSTGNQRIERWWCTLRSECTQFWMDHFDQLKADGLYDDSFIDKSLVQFCFQEVIQEELDEVAAIWNDHRIRASHNPRAPSGRPSMLYAVPNLYGAQNFVQQVDNTRIDLCLEDCSFKDYPCDEDLYHICIELMTEHNFLMSTDIYQITDLYLKLRQLVHDGLRE
ncbi:unnamed protein product [Arctogadus glacialis]